MNLLKNAKKAGVNITVVNGMIMDIFKEADWGVLPVQILENMHYQLKTEVFPEKTDQEIYRMLGATPMIGTDDTGAVFSIEHAKILAKYASEKNIGLVGYWSLQRDQVGTGDLGVYSQQNKTNFEYYNTFNGIIG
jgi:chitinase